MFGLLVAYDGTGFHGWQKQPHRRTVQGELERALETSLGEEIRLKGAGRTDAGVHARGQTASFRSATRLPLRALSARLAHEVPDDIVVKRVFERPPGFDALRSARARRYAYLLLREDDVLHRRFAWHPGGEIDGDGLVRATAPLEGRHDFSAFESAGSSRRDPVCTILRASWSRWEGGLRFDVVADRFLYRMVRNMVGTIVLASRHEDAAGHVARVLASRDRRRAAPPAPAHGLSLEQVFYEEVPA